MLFLFVASTKSNFRYISTRKLVLLHFLAIIIDEFSILRNSLVYSTLKKHQKWQKMKKSFFFFSNCFQPGINSTTIHTKEYCSKLCILCCIPNITRWGGWLPLPKKNNAGGFTLLEFQESQLQIYQIFVMSFPKKKYSKPPTLKILKI